MHSFQNFIVRLIHNHPPPPLETRIWKLVVKALILYLLILSENNVRKIILFAYLLAQFTGIILNELRQYSLKKQ